MHNIEKSKFQKGQYVGYGGGAVWHIRNYGKGNWRATPQGNNKHQVFSCATLRDVSTQLETLNKTYSDEWRLASLSSERKANPVKRSARFDANFKEYKGWHRWYKALFVKYPDAVITGDEQRAIAFSPYQAGNQIREGEVGRWNSEGRMGITEAFGTIYDMPTKMGRLTNPATRKRAISRPSQITKKAPSKRLVARRKLAAKKPVKGYFPNPLEAGVSSGKADQSKFPYHVQYMNQYSKWVSIGAFVNRADAFDYAKSAAKMDAELSFRVMKDE